MLIELTGTGEASEADVLAVVGDWLPAAARAEIWIGGRLVEAGDRRGRR